MDDRGRVCRYISGKQAGTNVPAVNNPMWQAPEVISNPGSCSKAGDVYSFGIILWELLMMRRPWQGTPLMFIQHLVQGGKRPEVPADLSQVPTPRPGEVLWGVEEYVRLMQRCWDADPDARPNFEHVVEELESIDKGASARMCDPPPPPLLYRAVHRTSAHSIVSRGGAGCRTGWPILACVGDCAAPVGYVVRAMLCCAMLSGCAERLC